jgi:hypothetical protein
MTHANIGSIALAEVGNLHVCCNVILCGKYVLGPVLENSPI